MKKIASVVTLISLMMSAQGEIYFNMDTLYPHTAVVSEVNYTENIVTVEDFNGNLWEFSETDDWSKGDIVSMIMDTKGTDSIYDDEIVSVKYSGYIEPEKTEDELFEEYLEEIECGNYEEG